MSDSIDFKYRAFLSYSHADTPLAKWLHSRLEGFPLRGLTGRATALGPVPRQLRPIFRDREDFSAGGSLNDQSIAALDASAALVVLCSPASAKSHYVNEEIRLFKHRHPGRPIVPVILAGKPDGGEQECFAPALRFELDAEGLITDRPASMSLAADVREEGDGRDLALAKVAASLIGVPSDEVYRRAERERRRWTRIRNGVIAALAVLAVFSTASALYARHQLKTNEAFLDHTLESFTELVNRAVAAGESYSMPVSATLGFLQTAEGMLKGMSEYGRPTPKLKYRRAIMLRAFADNYETLGRTSERERRLLEAKAIMTELAALDPGNDQWASELVAANERHGDLLAAKGQLSDALAQYTSCVERMKLLVQKDPAAPWRQRDFSVAYEKVGDVLNAQGDLAGALKAYSEDLAIAESLAKSDVGNTGSQRDLSIAYEKAGDVLKKQGALPEALKAYRDGLAIRERLAEADPSNSGWQRDLSVSHNKVGDVLIAQIDLPEALKAYRDGLAIAERLAKSDPANAVLQRDLSVSHDKVGNVLRSQGNLSEALKTYRDGLAIFERLTKSDPGNAGWLHDLSVSYKKVGDLLKVQGDLPEALKAYRDSLRVCQHLAEADPGNAQWQVDVAFAYGRLASYGDNPADNWLKVIDILLPLNGERRFWLVREALLRMAKEQLATPIGAAFEAGDFAKAAALQTELAAAVEKNEAEKDGKVGPFTAQQQGDMSWYRLFSHDFGKALKASERGLALAPGELWIATNRAHALMFLGRAEEARANYLEHKGKEIAGRGDWGEVVLKDFAEFEKRGLTHPQMAEIRGLLAPAARLQHQ